MLNKHWRMASCFPQFNLVLLISSPDDLQMRNERQTVEPIPRWAAPRGEMHINGIEFGHAREFSAFVFECISAPFARPSLGTIWLYACVCGLNMCVCARVCPRFSSVRCPSVCVPHASARVERAWVDGAGVLGPGVIGDRRSAVWGPGAAARIGAGGALWQPRGASILMGTHARCTNTSARRISYTYCRPPRDIDGSTRCVYTFGAAGVCLTPFAAARHIGA